MLGGLEFRTEGFGFRGTGLAVEGFFGVFLKAGVAAALGAHLLEGLGFCGFRVQRV